MPKKGIDEKGRALLENALGFGEEEIGIVEKNPKQREIAQTIDVFMSKKMIVECIQAENCMFHSVGDKYVFSGFGALVKQESCELPCLFAMCNFIPFAYMLYDRIASGLDPDGMHGGWGSSLFKISVVDSDPT